ncbi:hypothetical protein [Streptomyces sp. SID3343]|uniref:hypothetical protein n=1 Tax=Streptomyces sp. SID3343 TaxID=2690260 RepID=UPI00136DEC30|nr:hypothetical protein [Streptomyces sp. SID3343]MYW02694.1 hypothetical protein [Streptomyces sp. SID3343]
MSKRTKLAALASVGALAAVATLSGSASAGGPSTSPYDCVDARGGRFTAKVTYSTGGNLLKVSIGHPVPVSFAANTINTTAVFNGPSGAVVYDGTVNPPYTAGTPVLNLGPIPRVTGSILPGQPLNIVPATAPPSPTNWSLRVIFPGGYPAWYCGTRVPLSPPLVYN